jgi:hypothetical protein
MLNLISGDAIPAGILSRPDCRMRDEVLLSRHALD